MERLKRLFKWCITNPDTVLALGGLAVTALSVPAILAFIEGAFPSQVAMGLAGAFLAFIIGYAVWKRGKLWASDVRLRDRLESSSSPFDPMARIYQDKRLFLRDLAPAGRRYVQGKKFINCEIIGPGSILIGTRSTDTRPWPDFRNNLFEEGVDMIEVTNQRASNNAVFFPDCDFDGCHFFHLNLLFFERVGPPEWPWISKEGAQLQLGDKRDNAVGPTF